MQETYNKNLQIQDKMVELARKGLWKDVGALWEDHPLSLFTNEMLGYLSNHMMHPDYKHEGDFLVLKLLDPSLRQQMPHLRIRGNWILWEGITALRNLEMAEGFVEALSGEDIVNAGARLSVDVAFGEMLGRVVKKRKDILSQDALVLMRRNLHDENKFSIAAAAFFLLDGKTYWEGLEQMTFRDNRAKAYIKRHFEGGVFLQNTAYMEKTFFKTLKKYVGVKRVLCPEAMFVLFNDLQRWQPHLLEKVFEEYPKLSHVDMIEPFFTKYAITKEVLGKSQDGPKKKM